MGGGRNGRGTLWEGDVIEESIMGECVMGTNPRVWNDWWIFIEKQNMVWEFSFRNKISMKGGIEFGQNIKLKAKKLSCW